MRALIVDDEPLAREALAGILASRSDVDDFDSANDAVEALDKLSKASYDVVLLDINLPELSGIELLDQLRGGERPVPSVIFVTAHDEHAIKAFEQHAVDYVLKPFSSQRINEALTIAFRRSEGERASRIVEILPQLRSMSGRRAPKVAIKSKGRIIFINPADLSSVQAEGNYVLLQSGSGSYLLRESISIVADKLRPYGFIRIHRSALVNSTYVEEIQPLPTGEYALRLKGGKQFTVTRTYKKNLNNLAEFWIGNDSFSSE